MFSLVCDEKLQIFRCESINNCRTQEIIKGAQGKTRGMQRYFILYTTCTSSPLPEETEFELSLLFMILIVPKTLTKLYKAENGMSRTAV